MILTYLAQSAAVAGVALSGPIQFEIEESAGTVVDTRSNAELRLKKACLIQLSEMATITAKDPGTRPAIGASGALALVGAKHVGGTSLSGTLTFAAANITVKAVRSSVGDDGQPRVVIQVEILSTDGIASGLTVTSA